MQFIDVHKNMKGVTREQLRAAHAQDKANEGSEGVNFRKAWADPDSGSVFCLSEGPSKEAVQRVHERSGHPADEIYPVPVEVE